MWDVEQAWERECGSGDRKETRLFECRCLQGGTRLTPSGDLWSADGIGLFAIFGHYINEDFEICSGLLGLVSCGVEHHTGDYVKKKTEEVLLDLCLRPMNPSNQHAKASGRTLSLGGSQI